MKIYKYLAIGLLATGLTTSCGSDYLDGKDTSGLNSDQTAKAAENNQDAFLNGMWSEMVSASNHDAFGLKSWDIISDNMGQDIAYESLGWFQFDYDFDYRAEQYTRPFTQWNLFYTEISKANEIIALYPNPETDAQKGFVGQAYAIRGMAYDYLLQIFCTYENSDGTINRDAAGVPIIFTSIDGKSSEEIEAANGRNTVGAVLDEAERNLKIAVEDLANYQRPSTASGKDYIDQSVANGLLARHYLLAQNWQEAATAAKAARQGYTERDEEGLHDGFMDVTASDVMWGFDESTETQTAYASFFSQMSSLSPGYAGMADYGVPEIDAQLYNQIPDDDYRKSLFNGPDGDPNATYNGGKRPYTNLKYGYMASWLQDYIYMRSAEMILIEAEADARLGQNAQAANVLKELMVNRQPSWNKTTVTVDDVLLQRRIELWGEGFGFLDLKRCHKGIDRNYSGSNHAAGHRLAFGPDDARWTYQIPRREIQENSHIGQSDQNP